jgi:hypothetical protein
VGVPVGEGEAPIREAEEVLLLVVDQRRIAPTLPPALYLAALGLGLEAAHAAAEAALVEARRRVRLNERQGE